MIPFPYVSAHPTGSRYTVMPAVLDTDDDWLVLVDKLDDVVADMERREDSSPFTFKWERCTHQYPQDGKVEDWSFASWRGPGGVNLIVTDDRAFYLRSVAATLLAAKLNLQTKEERIALFRAVKFGEDYNGKLP